VIALTALAMKGDEDRIRAAGCDGYIAKPLAYKQFLATIADHLAKTAALKTSASTLESANKELDRGTREIAAPALAS
jgi:DNA-binding response OmpR family regulator